MPTFIVTDSKTGKEFEFEGDSAPTQKEILAGLATYSQQAYKPPANMGAMQQKFMDDTQARTPWEKTKANVADATRAAVPYIRPAVEGLGAAGGAILGAGGGLPTGPGALLTGAAGGALGYAAGKNIMDTLEGNWAQSPQEAAGRAVSDLMTGATYEMGGQAVMPAWRAGKEVVQAIRHPGKTVTAALDNVAKTKAGQRIRDAISKDAAISARSAANTDEYAQVSEAIPGFKLTPAQITDDPATLQLQQRLQMQTPEAKSALEAQTMGNRGAIDNYMQQSIKGGTIDDFLATLKAQQEARGAAVDSGIGNLSGMGKEAAGQTGREQAQAVRTSLKSQADGLYGQVPRDMPLDSTPLYRRLQELGDGVDPAFADPRNMPSGMMGRATGALEPKPSGLLGADGLPYNAPRMQQDIPNQMNYGQLMQYNEQVTKALRMAKSSGDFAKANNLSEIKSGIEQTLGLAERNGQGGGVDALRKANQFYRETYVPTVRQGATSKVLGITPTGGFRVDDAKVMGQYFRAGDDGIAGANSFNTTFKNNPDAKKALLDYAKSDLETTLAGATNPEKAINTWLTKHDNAIQKLNMGNEFQGLKQALQSQAELNSLGKILDSTDPHQTMKSLFQGANGRGSINNILDLKTLVKDSPAALNGLKRSFADMMIEQSQLSKQMGDDFLVSSAKLKGFWDKYEPAMKLLYNKEELTALKNVRSAFDMENRIGRSISGVNGSQTRDIGKMAGVALELVPGGGIVRKLASWGLDKAGQGQAEAVQQYLVRAQYDPTFAKELIGFGKLSGETAQRKAFDSAVARFATATAAGLLD